MFSRRRFLCGATASAFAAPAFLDAVAAEAASSNTILVIVAQLGGNDGLNTVIPLAQYGAYSGFRTPATAPSDPTLALNITQAAIQAAGTAFDANTATSAANATQYAFHPAMTGLRQVYAAGHLAVVTGIGTPPAETNRFSHQVGQFDWASGTINSLGRTTTGWAGLALDNAAGGILPPAVSLTGQTPTALQGAKQAPLVISAPLESFVLRNGGTSSADTTTRSALFTGIQGQTSGFTTTGYTRALSQSATGAIAQVQAIAASNLASDYVSTAYKASFLDTQLQQVARLIVGKSGARAYYVVHGGYDTHRAQNATHPVLLGQFSNALANFYAYIRAKGVSANVVVMSYSDFGRRVQANATYGTDHGSTQVTFVMGDPVKGGVYGQYPSLATLDSTANMTVQVDFRNQLSDVIAYMGADPTPIVGKTYAKLGFL